VNVNDSWACDTAVSLPEPVDYTGAHVKMYGFVFTEQGLFHDLSEADHETLRGPTYGPPADPTTTVYDDGL
jgi:hypothetical protein